MIITDGRAYPYKGGAAVQTTLPPEGNLSDEVLVVWKDKRTISREQQRKAWALCGEISAWCGDERESVNNTLKRDFLLKHADEMTLTIIQHFSLSDIDMTTARKYIDFLIDFVLENDVPTNVPLKDLCDDIQHYVYACLLNKKCAICGAKADLHHVEGSKIGMGNNRREVDHIGRECLPLCRIHHNEAHDHGDAALLQKYCLESVTIDEKIVKLYKLGGKRE